MTTSLLVRSQVVGRVHHGAVDPQHEVQVAPGAVAGGSDVRDDLALGDVLTDPHGIAGEMVVRGGHETAADVAMVDEQAVPVPAVVVLLGDGTRGGGVDRSAATRPEVR